MPKWRVKCNVCGRTFVRESFLPPAYPTMADHGLLGVDGKVLPGSRCIGSGRTGVLIEPQRGGSRRASRSGSSPGW